MRAGIESHLRLVAEILHSAMIDFFFCINFINIYWVAAARQVITMQWLELSVFSCQSVFRVFCWWMLWSWYPHSAVDYKTSVPSSYLGTPAIVKWTEAINSQPEQLTTELSPRLSAWNQVKRYLDSKKNQLSPVNKIFQIFPTTLFIL